MGVPGLDVPDCWKNGRSLVLYGAGGAGRAVLRHLRTHGIGVVAFLDAGAAAGEIRDGLPVHTLADWTGAGRVDGTDVIVSLHNPFVDVAEVIGTLRASGFTRVFSMIDYVNLFPADPAERYWLVPSDYYNDKQHHIDAARALLSDELSRTWFDAALRLRRGGDYGALPVPRQSEQYMPADLPRWSEPMRLIDCGAYDGDTIEAMLRQDYAIEAVVAFEPEPDNYTRLTARFAGLNGVFLPCGVLSGADAVRFAAGRGPSGGIGDGGDTTIQCISIDEAMPSFAPTLIKMDIEGAEPAALRGAERTLHRYRPGLAISIYHKPGHLWEIPLWLAERNPTYRMYLRGHGHSGYDMVLYCRAD